MEQAVSLVYEQDQKVVTDSITIAAVFEKRHDKVLRDIRELKCSDDFRLLNFGESFYQNKQGREMPLFLVTENGFYMLAMGYTGSKAMEYKERYINEFERMRTNLENRNKVLDARQNHENASLLLEEYERRITLISKQQKEIQSAIRSQIYRLFPNTPDKGRRKYYSKIYQDLKIEFNVESYRDIRSIDFEEAKKFIANWGLSKFGEWKIGGAASERKTAYS